jgi:hypothetical protein
MVGGSDMPRESSIVRSILRFLNGVELCVARKLHGDQYSVSGDPDIYGSYRGRCFQIEVKQPKGRVSPAQEYRLEEWKLSGAFCTVARCVEDAQRLLDSIDSAIKGTTGSVYSWRDVDAGGDR